MRGKEVSVTRAPTGRVTGSGFGRGVCAKAAGSKIV